MNGSCWIVEIEKTKKFEKYFLPLIDDEVLRTKIENMKKRDWLDNLPRLVEEYNQLN